MSLVRLKNFRDLGTITNFKEKGQKQKFIWSQFNDCEKVEDKILISYWYKINPGLH